MIEPIRRARPVCVWCHRRPTLASILGSWRLVARHDVCRQCWRSFMDACEAARLPSSTLAA
jgi:hypothetical protein